MASKKKGCIVLKKNNQLKVTYSHRNSELPLLGQKIVKWVRKAGPQAISEYFDKVQLVKEEEPMTAEQIESYKKYMPEQLWKDDLTWPEALAYTKNAVAPLKDEYPWMVDYAGFNGAWVNRYRYIIDLDENLFIVVRGGMELLCQPTDEFTSECVWFDKLSHCEIGRFPLDAIPEDWEEQCDNYWKNNIMIVAVDFRKNNAALESEWIQSFSKGGYNDADYDWEKIKFFYGQNDYNERFDDTKK